MNLKLPKRSLFILIIFIISFLGHAQVGVGTLTPANSAQLDVTATNKGVLIPRINLTGSTDTSTITSGNVNSLLVFNTATISDIKPGYYYWFNDKWNRILISADVTSSSANVVYNPTTQLFSYIDANGNMQLIDFSTIVKANETVTTLVNNSGGFYTYINEAGTAVNIDIVGDVTTNFSTIANNPAVTNILQQIVVKTKGIVTYNSVTNQFSYVDASGSTQVIDISSAVKANETVTTLVNNSGGSYTYTNEAGTAVNIDVVGDVTTNFSTIANNPAVTNILQDIVIKTKGIVTYNSVTNEFSYVDASGNTQVINLSTIVKANETVTNMVQAPATGVITYTNEAGTVQTANVTSTDTGNILTVGADGGSLLSSASLANATSVSNASAGNTSTITVNGKTSTGAPIINSNTLTAVDGNLVSTVNGVATTATVPVLISANNGVTATNGNVQLGGSLINPTTITTDNNSTLALKGLQQGTPTGELLMVEPTTDVIRKISINNLTGVIKEELIATGGQKDFPTPQPITSLDKIQVFRNGTEINFTATPGTSQLTLQLYADTNGACLEGDEIKIYQWK